MKVVIFGAGGMSAGITEILTEGGHEVVELDQLDCDAANRDEVFAAVFEHEPDWLINCAGISDRHDETPLEVMRANWLTAVEVAEERLPTILIGSVAGMYGKAEHPYYSAAKAAVIRLTESLAADGQDVWCISPGRVDTPMRENDWPGEDRRTRLAPTEIGKVVLAIMAGHYKPGANVIVRKIGLERIEVFEDINPWKHPAVGL